MRPPAHRNAQTNVLLAPILAHARRAPRACAIRSRERTWTYARLVAQVADYAAALGDLGIDRDDIIALSSERSAATIALMLAIIANGAAYLPLDATYPETRLAGMIEAAQPLLAVVDAPLRARLPADSMCVERSVLAGNRHGLYLKGSGALAYVLFTSGSTGAPKGVAMRTAAAAALLDWQRAHTRLGRAARTLQFAPLSFDVSFQEIFSTLGTGGTLILPTAAERRDPWALLELLRRERIERLFLPYVSLQTLADCVREETPPETLIDVIAAGEQLRVTPAIRAFFSALPDCVLHNQYGPTETHVVTAHELHGNAMLWPELPPIGAALPHVHTRLSPIDNEVGDEGELLLGGGCLAAGYIGRSELTAARFVKLDGERWYRSGDRVRRHANGEFEYLGRLDEQIKLAGNRVKPAEVENVLCRHSTVAQAAVVAEERRGGRRLIAHIVPHEGTDSTVAERVLGAYCAAVLPEFLRPHAFRVHAALPTTASGKIDRHALARAQADEPHVAWDEATPLREQLVSLWRQLLGVEGLDAAASVFDLGARSLDVVQALTELRRRGHALSVAQVYEHPTIAAQLRLLLEREPQAQASQADARAHRQRDALARMTAGGGR